MSTYRTYLKTLRRVPDNIVLATASREIVPNATRQCLCGWFLREQLAAMAARTDAEEVNQYDDDMQDLVPGIGTPARCAQVFGGSYSEWSAVFNDITESDVMPHIERAFVERVLEAVS